MFSAWWSTQMETQLLDRVHYSLYVLASCLAVRIYNLTKFARFDRAESDHQALSYVKVLSKTHL